MEDKINYELMKSLPTHRTAYSDRTALLMAHMSTLAYIEDERKLREELLKFGFKLGKQMNDSDTSAFFATSISGSFNVLAFTGTESIRDAFTDLAFLPKKFKSRTFHAGFLSAFKKVEDDVTSLCEKSDKPVVVTGHSLGAALAIIACSIAIKSSKVSACYTFGSPAAGDSSFDHSIMKFPIYRVVNSLDIVARVPPWHMGSGHLTFLTPNGKRYRGQQAVTLMSVTYVLIFVLSILWFPLLIIGSLLLPKGSGMLTGHLMKSYTPKLTKIAEERSGLNIGSGKRIYTKLVFYGLFLIKLIIYIWGINWVVVNYLKPFF